MHNNIMHKSTQLEAQFKHIIEKRAMRRDASKKIQQAWRSNRTSKRMVYESNEQMSGKIARQWTKQEEQLLFVLGVGIVSYLYTSLYCFFLQL